MPAADLTFLTHGFKDEVEYIQSKLAGLLQATDGFYSAADMPAFWVQFQQYGGWWQNSPSLGTPTAAGALDQKLNNAAAQFEGEGEFSLLPYVSPILGESGASHLHRRHVDAHVQAAAGRRAVQGHRVACACILHDLQHQIIKHTRDDKLVAHLPQSLEKQRGIDTRG